MKKKPPTFLSISEAARLKGVSRAAIHNAIRDKRLPANKGVYTIEKVVKITRRGWRILAEDLEKYEISPLHVWIGKKIA